MTEGVNANGEKNIYSYNGLGALMENTWVIAKNGYGYHDVNADDTVQTQTSNKDKPAVSNVKKMSTVKKQFVVDFTSDTYRPLQEHEVNGLDYRYVYSDKARLSAVVSGISNGSASLLDENGELHAYYHTDYLGTTDYLTSAVNSKVIAWTNYNEWGEITHNAVLKCGQRELDLVKEYATHDYDAVLDQYYAKARFYDASNRRFTAQDPILDPSRYDIPSYVKDPLQLDQYLYVKDNAVNYIDLYGEYQLAAYWTGSAWGLCAVDGFLPVGDVVYVIGIGICVIIDSWSTLSTINNDVMSTLKTNKVDTDIKYVNGKRVSTTLAGNVVNAYNWVPEKIDYFSILKCSDILNAKSPRLE